MDGEYWGSLRRAVLRSALVGWTVLFGAGHVAQVAAPDVPGEVPLDVRMQAAWLERSLSDLDAEVNQHLFPEGALFTWQFYGLALQNIAEQTRDPADVERATVVVRRLLPKIDALLTRPPFRRMAHWELRGGVCWFAGQNLLRVRLVSLAPDPTPEELSRVHADSALLHRAFLRSRTGVLEAHPGMSWPVDSLLGLESLLRHDQRFGTRYFDVYEKHRASVLRELDRETGLLPSMLHLDGRARDVPRGCALSWSISVLARLDPELARSQWEAYKRAMSGCALGLCFFREYPRGKGREADPDSGPIVAGYGMSATAFALAAARAIGDLERVGSLRRLGELLGLPSLSFWGKRYLGGTVSMFDVLALWVRTVPFEGARPSPGAPGLVLALAAGWAGAALLQLRGLRRAWAGVRAARRRAPAQAVLLAAAGAILVAHLALIQLSLPLAVVGLTAVELAGRAIEWLGRRSGVVSPAAP